MAVAQPITTSRSAADLSAQAQAAELVRWCSRRLDVLIADVRRLHESPPEDVDPERLQRWRARATDKLRNATRVMQEKLELADRAIDAVPVAQHGLVLAAMELRVTIATAIEVAAEVRRHPA
jgi:hypothetical protein